MKGLIWKISRIWPKKESVYGSFITSIAGLEVSTIFRFLEGEEQSVSEITSSGFSLFSYSSP